MRVGFASQAGHEALHCAAGAVDVSHIRILPPAKPHKKCYINHTPFPSVVLQGVCDSKGEFLDTCIGSTGWVHGAVVLQTFPMYKESLYPPASFFLLGDGDPCLQHPLSIMMLYHQHVAGNTQSKSFITFVTLHFSLGSIKFLPIHPFETLHRFYVTCILIIRPSNMPRSGALLSAALAC